MIIDSYNEFADAVSVAAAAGTALIGDVIPLGSINSDIGVPGNIYLVIEVDTEIITAGAAGTIQFFLASDAQAAIATDGSATIHLSSSSLVTDDAAANSSDLNAGGKIICAKLPMGTYEKYLGILCTVGTTTVTAGKINAFLTDNPPAQVYYPDAVN
jgi:hypothetical protein